MKKLFDVNEKLVKLRRELDETRKAVGEYAKVENPHHDHWHVDFRAAEAAVAAFGHQEEVAARYRIETSRAAAASNPMYTRLVCGCFSRLYCCACGGPSSNPDCWALHGAHGVWTTKHIVVHCDYHEIVPLPDPLPGEYIFDSETLEQFRQSVKGHPDLPAVYRYIASVRGFDEGRPMYDGEPAPPYPVHNAALDFGDWVKKPNQGGVFFDEPMEIEGD